MNDMRRRVVLRSIGAVGNAGSLAGCQQLTGSSSAEMHSIDIEYYSDQPNMFHVEVLDELGSGLFQWNDEITNTNLFQRCPGGILRTLLFKLMNNARSRLTGPLLTAQGVALH